MKKWFYFLGRRLRSPFSWTEPLTGAAASSAQWRVLCRCVLPVWRCRGGAGQHCPWAAAVPRCRDTTLATAGPVILYGDSGGFPRFRRAGGPARGAQGPRLRSRESAGVGLAGAGAHRRLAAARARQGLIPGNKFAFYKIVRYISRGPGRAHAAPPPLPASPPRRRAYAHRTVRSGSPRPRAAGRVRDAGKDGHENRPDRQGVAGRRRG